MSEPTTVYRAFDNDGTLLYIGMSRNWGNRWKQHSERSAWYPQVARVELEQHPTREAAAVAERRAVQTERPLHNIEHTPRDRRPWAHQHRRERPDWTVHSFDHRQAAGFDEYHRAARAISDLANALGNAHLYTQEQFIGLLADVGRSVCYGDCCAHCGIMAPIAEPIAVQLTDDGQGLTASYRHYCGHTWSCYWAVDAPLMMP